MKAVTDEQARFLMYFVLDGEYDLHITCNALGIRISHANAWFRDPKFQAELKKYNRAKLTRMGYGDLRTLEDVLAIAHSDISQVKVDADGLEGLPRRVRIAIKSVAFGVIVQPDGSSITYPKKVTMHDKAWALQRAAEWFKVEDAVKNGGVNEDDSAKRVAGLVVRPPLTPEQAAEPDLLAE